MAETSPTDAIVHVSKAMRTLPIIILGIVMIMLSKTITNMMALPVAFAGLVITLLSVTVELFAYLQNGRTASKKLDEAELDRIDQIEEALKKLALTMTASNEALASKVGAIDDQEALKRSIADHLARIDTQDLVEQAVKEVTLKEAKDQAHELKQYYDDVVGSLERQVADLGKRANVNLVMGSAITLMGLLILGYFVFYATHPVTVRPVEVAVYFGTRITLIVFIEIFAYFFLRLYRYSLFEIKYFQNEITNSRFKIIALRACFHEGSKDTLDKICLELVKTERNFILKKGETTISLRRDEIEQMNDNSVARIVEQVLIARGAKS